MDQPSDIEKAIASLQLRPGDVDLIVCTGADEILGIGDWGATWTDQRDAESAPAGLSGWVVHGLG